MFMTVTESSVTADIYYANQCFSISCIVVESYVLSHKQHYPKLRGTIGNNRCTLAAAKCIKRLLLFTTMRSERKLAQLKSVQRFNDAK